MDCRQCESSLAAYVLDDLPVEAGSACAAHLRTCASCREALAQYQCIVESVSDEPEAVPTASESAALAMALTRIRPAMPAVRPGLAREPLPRNLSALVWGSLLAFVVIAGSLALQVLGHIDFAAALWSIGPVRIALAVVIAVFITSFLPIAVTARRRPLNGMTFSR